MLPIILYDNRFNDGTPTATDSAAGFSVLNIKDMRPYTFWKGASAGVKYLTVDCGSAKSADCLGIIGHNLATVGATVSVECSSDDFGSDITVALAGFAPTNDRVILKTFTAQTKRYWRIKLAGTTAAAQIAVAMIGNKLQFPYPPQGGYIPYAEKIVANTVTGKKGHPLGTVVKYKPRKITARYNTISRSFVTDTYAPFWDSHASDLKPFFYAEDLDGYPENSFYVKVPDDEVYQTPVSISTLVDELTLNMEGVKE